MRWSPSRRTVSDMTETDVLKPAPPRRRLSLWALVLLALAMGAAALLVTISYGLALEYGDTGAPDGTIALQSYRDWGIGVALVAGLSAAAAAVARRSRGRRALTVAATVVIAATFVGVPVGAVVGVHQKLDRYPDLPSCTGEFTGGPAAPVTRKAQAAFEELNHPGPFSGGGSSGVDGCTSQLMVPQSLDAPAAYEETLAANGWRAGEDRADLLVATKDGLAFELSRDQDGSWWVWIGPDGLEVPPTEPGVVAPRR